MAVGAYTTALLMTHSHLNLVVELLAADGASAVMGIVVGIPATRLRGPYLAGMTLILAVGLPLLADKYSSVFGGDQGLTDHSNRPRRAPSTLRSGSRGSRSPAPLVTMLLLANLLREPVRQGFSGRARRRDSGLARREYTWRARR